ncbi:MAG: S8 family serine peptidase, partial [Saprospiraceae bacterium]
MQFIFLTNLHSQTPGYWKNRLLFKIDNSLPANVQKLADLQRNQQTKAIYQLLTAQKGIKFGKVFEYASSTELDRSFRVTLPANIDVADLMRKLELIPAVDYAEREPRHKGSLVPNDPSYSGQYAMGLIQAAAAFNIHTGGNAFVAIVDDACRITHQDLAANIRVNPNEIPGNLIDDDGNGKVDDMMGWDVADNDSNVNPPASANNNYFSHGTHVSGIACAVTNNGVGIASIGFNCKILPVKCTGNGADPEFIDEGFSGIDYAYRSGARVISCS